MKKILVVFGTRPEAIKMAPLVKQLQKFPNEISCKLCVTGQHREMLDQVLQLFSLVPDYDLDVMSPGQSLTELTSKIMLKVFPIIQSLEPDFIIVHGDTTTTLSASLAAYYQQVLVCHVEAGLRTDDIYAPWPEEINRRVTGVIANLHFAPTEEAKENLLNENVDQNSIFVVGNTVIDSLLHIQNTIDSTPSLQIKLKEEFSFIRSDCKLLLVTGHRRENFGEGFSNICKALKLLAETREDIQIVYPVHLNPHVLEPVKDILGSSERIHLIEPLNYSAFVYLMSKAYIVLTDSGGIQEEAPSLGKPVLVTRDKTERPEALAAGTIKLVGTCKDKIFNSIVDLLDNSGSYEFMSSAINPYGDGTAAKRIVQELLSYKSLENL
ncbi:UDP-N-acetylglucosamine 2-epimerase (non-hydrolyzing) [Gammaproteobacteria bacterium]|jgi:UDP-N-acetylglucosamine 2-epimerase (non-hydrolysing)|nr:UDP-N-acetylglucosamine 2-epimerase (non-hydrolyzing) [Gammaproteobacteria bacterium]